MFAKFRLLLPGLLSFCLPALAQTASRVVVPVDDSNRVTLQGNVYPLAQARFDCGPAALSTPTGRIALVLQRSAAQQHALTQYLADLQNPGSSNYHKWLTPAQYGAKFGISGSDLATVKSWLEAQGFKVDKVPEARNLVQFSGTFGQIQEAFHTSIHTFQVNGASHFASVSDPEIPAALAPVVAGVGPLNDFRPKPGVVQGPRSHYDTAEHRIKPDLTLQGQSGNNYLVVDPADAATIYDTPNQALNANYSGGASYDGTGVNIGIVGVSDLAVSDVANYRTAFLGETSANVNESTVVVDGNDPGLLAGDDAVEAVLDNEVAGGLAPKAKIYYYTAADTDLTWGLLDAILRAVDDNTVSILSLSFSTCESTMGSSVNQLVNEAAQQAAAQGISFVVSTGDNGSAGCDDFNSQLTATHGLAVNGFASTPYTIAVGGTDFDALETSISNYVNTSSAGNPPYYGTAKGYIPEAVWNDSTTTTGSYSANIPYKDSNGNTNIVAGSGGVSAVYSKPAFQTSITPADNARDLPDMSLFAADGFHNAYWALCSDNATDNSSSTYTDCLTTNGSFTSSTTFSGAGGTSAAAPAFAGMLALISQSQGGARLGQADTILYQLARSNASAFRDVTTGNNSVVCAAGTANCGSNDFLGGYDAATGYDLASGLGSVDVTALATAWGSASVTSTSTTLQINGSTAAYTGVHGASLTFNVGVNPTPARGNVAIVDTASMNSGGTLNNGQFSIPLSSGSGTASYNGLPGGSYTVSAHYGGDTSDAASTSASIPVTIAPETSTTTLMVNAYDAASGNPLSSLSNIPAGDPIFLDALILGAADGNSTLGVATGTVTFYKGSTQLGTGNVDAGFNVASWPPENFSFVTLAPGTYRVTAKYSGDASYDASTSNSVTFTVVAPASPAISLGNGGNISVTAGASGTSVLTVTPSGGFTGQVNFACAVGGSPAGLTCSVPPTMISGTAAATSTLTAATSSSTPAGNYAATITASDAATGRITSTTTLTIAVGSSISAGISLSNSGNIRVARGATTGNTTTITVTPAGGFTGQVNLACAVTTSISNPNDPTTCSITTPLTINGTAAATATLTAKTTASISGALERPLGRFFVGGGATLAMLLFFGVPARQRAWRGMLALVAILFIGAVTGCGMRYGTLRTSSGGSTGNAGTTPGTYMITVTSADAATGKLTAKTTVMLTVN